MFYDEKKTIESCEEEPSLIFDLIEEDHEELVDKILTKRIVNINTVNKEGNDILSHLLKKGWYELVLKHMKKKEWNVNHQNNEGNTFAHILVGKRYLEVMQIMKELFKNNNWIPNIRNKRKETILDCSIRHNSIYASKKILEEERFDNIDLISFKNFYESYIKNNEYGTYSKLTNLEVIVDNLVDKELLPRVEKLIFKISKNMDLIKAEVIQNETKVLDQIIYDSLKESIA